MVLLAVCVARQKNLVIRRKFLFHQWRTAIRPIYHASTPFGYFPAKHANEIAVSLNRIDHIERPKQQTDCGETKHNGVKFESHRAARGA
jgi:hypothetical protein